MGIDASMSGSAEIVETYRRAELRLRLLLLGDGSDVPPLVKGETPRQRVSSEIKHLRAAFDALLQTELESHTELCCCGIRSGERVGDDRIAARGGRPSTRGARAHDGGRGFGDARSEPEHALPGDQAWRSSGEEADGRASRADQDPESRGREASRVRSVAWVVRPRRLAGATSLESAVPYREPEHGAVRERADPRPCAPRSEMPIGGHERGPDRAGMRDGEHAARGWRWLELEQRRDDPALKLVVRLAVRPAGPPADVDSLREAAPSTSSTVRPCQSPTSISRRASSSLRLEPERRRRRSGRLARSSQRARVDGGKAFVAQRVRELARLARPASFSGVSAWPWKRRSRFQSVSPCRTRTIVVGTRDTLGAWISDSTASAASSPARPPGSVSRSLDSSSRRARVVVTAVARDAPGVGEVAHVARRSLARGRAGAGRRRGGDARSAGSTCS